MNENTMQVFLQIFEMKNYWKTIKLDYDTVSSRSGLLFRTVIENNKHKQKPFNYNFKVKRAAYDIIYDITKSAKLAPTAIWLVDYRYYVMLLN